ncbi:hypothetical protein E3P77_02205 [Wallemia ichthyophaga]|uniref:RRM domain-containing protein n=1 Tax=Wallemia ichthyophaga TaxID=245174 RepID=A0A4T0LBH0_WALIC|nr:hypothetical protein E3P97_02459 [Wallemia ichthyophaga]TIB29843.1 hypothetical protein E3P86_03609 [Wallemia ichthyophaga]TIB31823.1 hypothetical protein E3P85_02109 [Wallemia ichthyophaga]TIB46178.1 hypothetical protein E3P82_02385 [Wallemia ichthyophaga]TIB49887.1 hypothetical protein E3P81_02357 [Wallemia ichthyophaga]
MSSSSSSGSESDSGSEVHEEVNTQQVQAQAGDSEHPQPEEEKALSHKERRKQRREAAMAEKNAGADDQEKTESTAKTEASGQAPEKEKRSHWGVWIGNLSFKTTRERLFEWIANNIGESEDVITRINMPKGHQAHEHNKGFAYVDLSTEDIMHKVIAQSENNLDGRKLLIKSSSNFEGRPKPQLPEGIADEKDLSKFSRKILSSQQNKPNPTLFFGNLSFDTTQESIKNWLVSNAEKHHKRQIEQNKAGADDKLDVGIKRVRLGTFPDSGKCKGWCFIDFKNTSQATSALCESHNHKMYGRELKVQFGQDRSEQKKRKFDKESEKEGGGRERQDDSSKPPKRAKPGAALANAQRSDKASGAINQPAAGNKITFD